jgi:hypothetical protein
LPSQAPLRLRPRSAAAFDEVLAHEPRLVDIGAARSCGPQLLVGVATQAIWFTDVEAVCREKGDTFWLLTANADGGSHEGDKALPQAQALMSLTRDLQGDEPGIEHDDLGGTTCLRDVAHRHAKLANIATAYRTGFFDNFRNLFRETSPMDHTSQTRLAGADINPVFFAPGDAINDTKFLHPWLSNEHGIIVGTQAGLKR